MDKRSQIILLCVVILFFYWRIFFIFFQGDEWFYFSQFLSLTHSPYGILLALKKSLIDSYAVSGGGHITPIYNMVWFAFNQLFGLSYFPYALASLLLHIVNSYLVYAFVYRISGKNKYVSTIASLFFAVSYTHQQAVTWIMAFIPTTLSVTFFLSGLLFFFDSLMSKEKKVILRKLRIGLVLFIAALFTKESTAILFLIIPLLIWIYKRSLKNVYMKYYLLLVGFYLPYRTLTHFISVWMAELTGSTTENQAFELSLMIFRVITYPLKLLAEVFIPQEFFLFVSQSLTPLAYPTYGAEKDVGGINYLTFTQSAGSEIIIYLVSISLIWLIGFSLYKISQRKDKTALYALVIGLGILLSSSLPLLLIPLYAPWWGYMTFIDSRHLYVASVGASILFAYAICAVPTILSLVRPITKNTKKYIIIGLMIIWMSVHYILMKNNFEFLTTMAQQRKDIISTILRKVDGNSQDTVVLLTSDTGYYGFGPIPPFQTNLGQILAIYYYNDHKLPADFIESQYLTKGGLAGEGFARYENKGFGYFVDKNTLLREVAKGTFQPNAIYAFSWKGKSNQIISLTPVVREEAKEYLTKVQQFGDWNMYQDQKGLFSLKYPQDMTVLDNTQEVHTEDETIVRSILLSKNPAFGDTVINIALKTKPSTIPFSEYVSLMYNSDQERIGKHFTFRNIPLLNRNTITTVYPQDGMFPKYFLPYKTEDMFFEVFVYGMGQERSFFDNGKELEEKYNADVEKVLSTLEYE